MTIGMLDNDMALAEHSLVHELEARLEALEAEVGSLKRQLAAKLPRNHASIICFSGEWDRLFAALTIASGALALGMEVDMFFTFWAVSALRTKDEPAKKGLSRVQTLFSRMLPRGFPRAPLSKFNFAGLGKVLMRQVMEQEGVDDIDVLFEQVRDLGANLHLCTTSADLFGVDCQELSGGEAINRCGVATFMSCALKSKVVLFV